jgi:small subunit ribosomal protein S6
MLRMVSFSVVRLRRPLRDLSPPLPRYGCAVETQRKESLLDKVTRPDRDYELMLILLPDMPEEDNQAAIDKVRSYITAVNAEITETLTDSPWGRRRLAYTIRYENVDYRDGFYVVIHFTSQPNVIGEIERELKLDTNVIRYLLVMDDPKAGEKITEQPEAVAAAAVDETEAAPTPADETVAEAPATETTTDETVAEAPAVETTTDADEAPATETSTEAVEETPAETEPEAAADTETETAVEETAEAIEGEEEPAPADGVEAEVATKES